jgi:hypothetical protein
MSTDSDEKKKGKEKQAKIARYFGEKYSQSCVNAG